MQNSDWIFEEYLLKNNLENFHPTAKTLAVTTRKYPYAIPFYLSINAIYYLKYYRHLNRDFF